MLWHNVLSRRGSRGGGKDGETDSRKQRGRPSTPTMLLSILFVAVVLGTAGLVEAQQKTETLQERGDRLHRGLQQRSRAPRNAEPVEKTAGIGRPCAEADDFDYYSLGASFEGLKLTTSGRQCSPPPPKVRAADGTLVYMGASRVNAVAFLYGTCEPPSGTDGGCEPPLSISNFPACEQPRSLYKRYSGSGTPVRYKKSLVRGAPAGIFDERPRGGSFRLEVYTGDAHVLITGNDAEMVKRAADQMVASSSSLGGAKRARIDLPAPISRAADEDAIQNPKC